MCYSNTQSSTRKQGICRKGPNGLAAAALYIACLQTGEHKTQHSISEAASITEVTVRNRCKTLRASQNIDF